MDATGEYFSVLVLKRLSQFLHSQIHFATEMLTASSAKVDCIISTCFSCPVTSNFGTKNSTYILRYLIGIISSHTKCLMKLSWKYFFFVQKWRRISKQILFTLISHSESFALKSQLLWQCLFILFLRPSTKIPRRRLKPLHFCSNSYSFLINSLLIQEQATDSNIER